MNVEKFAVVVQAGDTPLEGDLAMPQGARGIVVFAHGSGSSRFSSRNRYVADTLNDAGLATLLFDLLTPEEHVLDLETRELRFDIALLSRRLTDTVDWVHAQARTQALRIGLFGASTGAAAAIVAAAARPDNVGAVVSRGGRPDLAGNALRNLQAPTLLIVGGDDIPVIKLNRDAAAQINAEHRLDIVPGATHLFEEAGKLEIVARLASEWFHAHLVAQTEAIPGL